MARNIVQFQKGLKEPVFEQQYRARSNAGQSSLRHAGRVALNARHAVAAYLVVTTRDLYQCANCRRQTSPIAGTILHHFAKPIRFPSGS